MNQKIVWTCIAFIAIQSISPSFGCFAQLENNQNENESNDETGISLDLPSIFPIVRMIKGQIKEIVIDLAMQVFSFIRAIAQDIKVRLLKRLGKYTLTDCFHLIFDGVIEFVEETPESNTSEVATEATANMATTEKTTTEKATTEMATTEKSTTEKTSTTTTTTEASNENEDEPENTRNVFYQNPYIWYYK